MRKTFKAYLKHGVTLTIKADDCTIRWDGEGEITEYNFPNVKRWVVFMPSDIVAVERVK